MRTNGHNSRRAAAAALAAALVFGATPAAAQEQVYDLSSGSSAVMPRIPDIEVPKHIVDGAKRVGITLPDRIRFAPSKAQATQSLPAKQQLLLAESEKQLLKEGHTRDAEAQRIAAEWADQAVRGEAKFTGDVGRGVTATDRGTGNIYRMTPQEVDERLVYLNRDETVAQVETTPVKNPKRFGLATATVGETTYLVEFFLN